MSYTSTDADTNTRGFNTQRRDVATEDASTEAIESQTAKIPSDLFLLAAGGAMAVSLGFRLAKKNSLSLFFGQWVAPFLLFGVYNKIVKTLGHDQKDNGIAGPATG